MHIKHHLTSAASRESIEILADLIKTGASALQSLQSLLTLMNFFGAVWLVGQKSINTTKQIKTIGEYKMNLKKKKKKISPKIVYEVRN